ncbi:MAG: class I SAM-dependent methyltransferase [Deltaproteobacteria bacterium]|nr:class I SAM-dependent methyltransferase [Deltaproteobacteria bacterium]
MGTSGWNAHGRRSSASTRFRPVPDRELDAGELRRISTATLAHYDGSADSFWQATRDHDVRQNIEALLRHLPPGRRRVLDFGCGPGRDLAAFTALGHDAVGLDGARNFVAMARRFSGCEVLHQDFLALALAPESFDGVFANASFFHVPAQEMPRVLGALRTALRPGGVFFASNPHGANEEGWNRGRYGSYLDAPTWRRVVMAAGFTELEHYYRPAGLPRAQQPWLATVWRR